MLSAREFSPARAGRPEAGFTLVELLVALAAGLLVMLGATTILIVMMHQTQRTFTRIDATRQARTAFGAIENELHSACVNGSPPIEGVAADGTTVESDNNNLVFLSYFGNAANPSPVWHQLSYSAAQGTLTDTSYNATYTPSQTGNDWTRGPLISANRLLSNLPQQPTTPPVFQYFAYQQVGTDSSGNAYYAIADGTNVSPLTGVLLNPAPLNASSGLSALDAGNTVEVVINLLVGPSAQNISSSLLTSVDDAVSDSISLRLTTPPDYSPGGASTGEYGPCM
jgi:prepilin-type N-terminal cleavage/methylation domain-containing protein